MIGLSKTSTTQEIIEKPDSNTAVRYKVVSESIDLGELKNELAEWTNMTAPNNRELIELGKMSHPYYMDRDLQISILTKKIQEVNNG